MAVAPPGPPRPRAASGGRIFIILGGFLAVVAFGAVFLLSTLGGPRGGGPSGPTTHVVYAGKDIPLRTQILTTDQVEIKDLLASEVPPGAFTIPATVKEADLLNQALKLVQGDIAEVNISKDQPILANMLAKSTDVVTGAQAGYLPIPPGYVAFTIPTNEQIGVANNIQPGDYISIIASLGSAKKAAVAIVYSQLRVLRTGPAVLATTPAGGSGSSAGGAPPPSTGPASSLTVMTNPCAASFLKWFQNNAQLTYVLESYKDYAKDPTAPDAFCSGVQSAEARLGVKADDIILRFPAFQAALST